MDTNIARIGQNIEMYKGNDKIIIVSIYDKNNILTDITGTSWHWVVYKNTQGTIVISKNSPTDIIVGSGLGGPINIYLIPEDTENLIPGNYLHEGELTDSLGRVTTSFTGKFIIIDSKA